MKGIRPHKFNGSYIALLLCLMLIFQPFYNTVHSNEITAPTPNENSDYVDYSDGDEQGPAQQVKLSTNKPEPTLKPFFEKNETVVYTKLNASVKLDCPAKNYDAKRHAILWFKESKAISNGNDTFGEFYHLDNKFSLTITPTTDVTAGNYYCNVLPSDARAKFIVKIGDPEPSSGANALMLKTILLILSSLLASFGCIQKHF